MILEALEIAHQFEGFFLFENLSFSLSPGESLAITGRSGSGKTTLLHIMAALLSPTRGSVLINKETITPRKRNQSIGFVFQSPLFLEELPLLDNILTPLAISRRVDKSDIDRAKMLLAKVGLEGKEKSAPRLLSGGERQRGALVRALIQNPSFLFADEPTGNLDVKAQGEVRELLFSLVKEERAALLLVTHDLALAKECKRHLPLEN